MTTRKNAVYASPNAEHTPAPERCITVAISLFKNASRFEWFLEKATEIGIQTIIPLLCERTEREHFRYDRMVGHSHQRYAAKSAKLAACICTNR